MPNFYACSNLTGDCAANPSQDLFSTGFTGALADGEAYGARATILSFLFSKKRVNEAVLAIGRPDFTKIITIY